MAEVHTTPQMEGERPKFEAWIIEATASPDGKQLVRRDDDGTYINDFVAHAWTGWLGRAYG